MGGFKKSIIINKILEFINNWDFEKNGKIILNKILIDFGLGLVIVKRRGKEIKLFIKKLNEELFGV